MNFREAYQKGFGKILYLKDKLGGSFPHITKEGEWLTNENGHWTGGFWIGLLWLLYLQKEEEDLKREIDQYIEKLAVRMKDSKTHDMGFIFGPSCIFGDRIVSNPRWKGMALSGAQNMERLYKEKVGMIQAWDEPDYEGIAIVDTIMNIPIMAWATDSFGEQGLKKKALKAADNILRNHVRADFSTFHTVRWDQESFEIKERSTHQGYKPDTCWSRGQAWAFYGFANMYRYTKEKKYLEASEKLAGYYWDHTDKETHLPSWDFFFKDRKEEPLDASAASIASSGMLLLSSLYKEEGAVKLSEKWQQRAEAIVHSLIGNCFYQKIDRYGIIEKVTVDKPRNSGVGESSMYGDYYFMEALFRLQYPEKSNLLY